MNGVGGQGELVSRVGLRDANGCVVGFLAPAEGPISKREAARCFAFAGVNQTVGQERWLGADGDDSIHAKNLVSAINAFCEPMDKHSVDEARAALKRGRPDLAALARLVYSVEAVCLNAWALRLPGSLDGLAALELWPRGWVYHPAEKADCQAWVWPSSASVAAFGFEGPDGGVLALAAAEANARCAPWFPIELKSGGDGPRLELDARLAWGGAVCERLAGCAWMMPWATSKDGLSEGGRREVDPQLSRRLWMDDPDPWRRRSSEEMDHGDSLKKNGGRGEEADGVADQGRSALAEPLALAVGVNAGVRMALGRDERLARLASATLVGWAAKSRHGQVASSLEAVLSGGSHMPNVAAAILPILALVQAGAMAEQGLGGADREPVRGHQGGGRL